MRFKTLLLLAVLLFPASQSMAAMAGVQSVQIVPSSPTNLDNITFNVRGWMSNPSIVFAGAQFNQIGTLLQLDLFFYSTLPPGGVVIQLAMPLDYSHQIAPLAPGAYTLQVSVNPWGIGDPLPYTTTFIVTNPPLNVPADFPTIQAAINAAATGDTIILADGTYTGTGNRDIDFLGKAIILKSLNGPKNCIIDCQNSGHRAFYFHSGETTSSIINGFTISNGNASTEGGAILCTSGSPLIKNCIIKNCKAGPPASGNAYGGAISCGQGTIITNCALINNTVQGANRTYSPDGPPGNGYGGAIYTSGLTTIVDCNISNNKAKPGIGDLMVGYAIPYGGAVYGPFNLSNSVLSGNVANPDDLSPAYGGALYAQGTSSIVNCLIINNACVTPFTYGNAIWNAASLSISNCTVYGNSIASEPFLAISGSGTGTIINSIVWGNSPGPDISNMSVTYSCLEESITGTGNISSNPRFVSGPQGNYYLSQIAGGQGVDSPCINAGSASVASLGLDTLTTNTIGIADSGTVDMGYHYPVLNKIDMNSDFHNDFEDFALFAADWLTNQTRSDFVPDGSIDNKDLAVLFDDWLACYVAKASNPNPSDAAALANNYLTWSAGAGAVSHDVYVGLDSESVNSATRTSDSFKGNVLNARFDLSSIQPATNYWRIDEVGPACTQKGDVWSFNASLPGQASIPYPQDNAIDIATFVGLAWSAAANTVSHDVYFGTDLTAVTNADHSSPEFKANTISSSYRITLLASTTYYWRVDEVGLAGTSTGTVWTFQTSAQQSLDPNLVGWWKLDEGTGTTAFDSAGVSDGTISGAPQWISGHVDGALDFDGIDDRVTIPDNPVLTPSKNMTLSFWVMSRSPKDVGVFKNASCPGGYGSPGNSRSYELCILSTSGKVRFQLFSAVSTYDYIDTVATVAPNQWHLLTGTFGGGSMKVYIDGQLDTSKTPSINTVMNDAQPLIIGGLWYYCESSPAFMPSDGLIDDVRMYNRVLSADEVQQLFLGTLP